MSATATPDAVKKRGGQPARRKKFLDPVECGQNLYRDVGFGEARLPVTDQAGAEAAAMQAALDQAQTLAAAKAAEPCPSRRCSRKSPAIPAPTFETAMIVDSEPRTAVFDFAVPFFGGRVTIVVPYWYASATVQWDVAFACVPSSE